jgi:lysophospholipase L1-like esterase
MTRQTDTLPDCSRFDFRLEKFRAARDECCPHCFPLKMKSNFLPVVLGILPFFSWPARAAELPPPIFKNNERILFQGDSITDGNRGRNADPNHILGHGYVFIIAAKYGASYPERTLAFVNRGISGNKVTDLEARWQGDALSLKPDVLSILIGVNDAGSVVDNKVPAVTVDEYAKVYDDLVQQTLTALPKVRFVFCEPFILKVGHTDNEKWPQWKSEIEQRQKVVEKLAAKYRAPVVHFQKMFDDACKRAPVNYWIWDGVHPTYSGHQLMADEWVRTVNAFYGKSQ